MFDNPQKDLERLQQQLLAAEEEDLWEPEEEDPEQALQDVKNMLARDDWDETAREPLYRRFTEEEPEPAPAPRRPAVREEIPEPVETGKGIGGLVTIMVLELLLLGLVGAWWMLWR